MKCKFCGEEMLDEANFCPYCGEKLSGSAFIVQELTEHPQVHSGVSRDVVQEEGVIKSIFDKFFSANDSYGKDLMITEEKKLSYDEWKEIKEYIGTDKLLMVYDYCGRGEMGFLITERKFILEDQYGVQQYPLEEIKGFMMDKKVLANVMYVVTLDGKRSRDVYLTSIDDIKHFQVVFLKFFGEIFDFYHPKSLKENQELLWYDLGAICEQYRFNSPQAENGSPLNERNSKKYNKAFVNFAIDNGEEVYFIYDSTVLGSCKQGFALCSSGLYGCDSDNQKLYIPWKTFKTISYKRGLIEFKIGKRGFSTTGDTKAIIRMFDAIKSGL